MSRMPTLVSVVGARPQFVKLAPLCRAIERRASEGGGPLRHVIVHTGQHYDRAMSDVFFEDLDLPRPDVNLGVGSGPHGRQTARMLASLEAFLSGVSPDAVLVFGDTNSTLAGALVAAKLNIPLAHVEAGLRSFNRRMPEELNRIAADHLSDLLFAPTATAVANLEAEGLGGRTVRSGDVMLEALDFGRARALVRSRVLEQLRIGARPFALATVHRAENVDGDRLGRLFGALGRVADEGLDVVVPLHPRTRRRLDAGHAASRPAGLRIVDPVRYLDMLRLLEASRLVLTDSGGLQKEAFILGRPCVTLRDETEWVETVEAGGNVVAGTEPEAIVEAVRGWAGRLNRNGLQVGAAAEELFGPSHAADRILDAVLEAH